MSRVPPNHGHKQRGAVMVALMAGIAIAMILSTVAVQTTCGALPLWAGCTRVTGG